MLLSDLLELTYAGSKLSQNAFALYWAESDEAKKALKEEVEKWRNRILSVEPTGPEKGSESPQNPPSIAPELISGVETSGS